MQHYITTLDHFEYVNSDYLFLIETDEPIYFIRDNKLKEAVLSSQFESLFGRLFTTRIKAGNYLYSPVFFSNEVTYKKNVVTEKLYHYYGFSQTLSISLWMIKDNSVNTLFSLYSDDQSNLGMYITKDLMVSNSRGRFETTTFNDTELTTAEDWLAIVYLYLSKKRIGLRAYSDYNNLSNEIDHNTSSFERALIYLQQARNSSFIPAKIASYISILETLFVVSDSNTYKTPERTAVFLGGLLIERKENFKKVKDAYSVRSSYVHGSNITKKLNKRLDEISFDLDIIIRKVLIKFFTQNSDLNYEGEDSNRVNEYFIDLVLGGS